MTSYSVLLQELNGFLAILAAILHITDIQFEEDHDLDGVFIRNEEMLEMAAQLLAIYPEELASALISNVHSLRGSGFFASTLIFVLHFH